MSLGIADSDNPDQSVHLYSLIRALAVHKQNHWILSNVSKESKGPDETLGICKMMWQTNKVPSDMHKMYILCMLEGTLFV